MLISKPLIKKCHEIPNEELRDGEEGVSLSFPRLFQQSKQMSQIIAYIWFWAGETRLTKEEFNGSEEEWNSYNANFENAKKLAKYYEAPNGNPDTTDPADRDRTFKKLLSAIPKEEGNEEERLLYAVFPFPSPEEYPQGYIFPILNPSEQKYYAYTIDTNAFQGTIEDHNLNEPEMMRFRTPYPPCPKFSEITVTKQELKEWLENRESDQVISDNPYIPVCSS